MKTSVIEVHDMLSVLSVVGVENRIGEVGGVESVTVNYAAESATVRYDETRLSIPDIRSAVRQNGYESDGESAAPETLPTEEPTTPEERVKPETAAQMAAVGKKDQKGKPLTPSIVNPPKGKVEAGTERHASEPKAESHADHKTVEMSLDKERADDSAQSLASKSAVVEVQKKRE